MNKKVIFGAAFATAALLSFKVFSSFATAGNTANITGGSNWDICVSTSTNYNGSRFTADISATGFESQIVFDGFNNQACKTVKLDSGNYTVVLNNPMLTDNVSYTISGTTLTYTVSDLNSKYINNYGSLDYETKASTMEITFDANGGSGTMNNQQFTVGTADTLTTNAFTGTGSFDGWNTAADGSGTSYTDGQSVTFTQGGELTLYAQWQQSRVATDIIAGKENGLSGYEIDFTRKAIVSNDVSTANGNGVNAYLENGQTVYYYRGEINDNNVIWANMCWKIVRTTATGGTKMVYNGEPTSVVVDGETVQQCNATGTDTQITLNVDGVDKNSFSFSKNREYKSPADNGYMFGARIEDASQPAGSNSYTFSNKVSRSGNTYTLDTTTGQSITGTWADERLNAAVRYHYFCTDGSTICDNTKIGYIHHFGDTSNIHYLPVDGYDDIAAMMAAMFTNTTDSNAKTIIESWFEAENLDGHIADSYDYEDDL